MDLASLGYSKEESTAQTIKKKMNVCNLYNYVLLLSCPNDQHSFSFLSIHSKLPYSLFSLLVESCPNLSKLPMWLWRVDMEMGMYVEL